MLCNCYSFNSKLCMVIKGYSLKSLISGATRCILGALTGRMPAIHSFDDQRHRQLGAKALAMLLEFVCGGLQAVMNVNGLHLAWPLAGASQ